MEREIKRIEYSKNFLKSLRKLPAKIIDQAGEKEKIFRDNPFHPILKTHKLHGEKKEEWAFSIDYSYRISFVFLEDGKILFTDIGTHEQLY